MSINNRIICALMIAVALLAASCGGPKYLVKGLTLPPGSTEVSFDKDINMLNNLPIPMLGAGEIEHNVTVMFDCPKGWDSVAAHIDSRMQSAGYQDALASVGEFTGMEGAAAGMTEMNNMMRSYTKMGGKFSVILMNNNWMGDSTGMPGMKLGGGDYTLMVMEFEGDK